MRSDAGINGDAQCIEQMTWMFFLKGYDTQEETWEYKATRRKRSTIVLSRNLSVGAYRLNRNFLGAIVTHM